MYDDTDTGLALSESYFSILQILRIATDWIQEGMDDLDGVVWHMRNLYASLLKKEGGRAVFDAFEESLTKVTSHQHTISKQLITRIEKKSEEINTLRDGVRTTTENKYVGHALSSNIIAAFQRHVYQRSG